MYIKDELFVFGTGSLGDAIKTLQMFRTAEETNATNRTKINHCFSPPQAIVNGEKTATQNTMSNM